MHAGGRIEKIIHWIRTEDSVYYKFRIRRAIPFQLSSGEIPAMETLKGKGSGAGFSSGPAFVYEGKESIKVINQQRMPVIVLADELNPLEVAMIDFSRVKGFAFNGGNEKSGVFFMLRASRKPLIMGLKNITDLVAPGTFMILDAVDGLAIVEPDEETVARYRELAKLPVPLFIPEMLGKGPRGTRAAAKEPARKRGAVAGVRRRSEKEKKDKKPAAIPGVRRRRAEPPKVEAEEIPEKEKEAVPALDMAMPDEEGGMMVTEKSPAGKAAEEKPKAAPKKEAPKEKKLSRREQRELELKKLREEREARRKKRS
jgi:hypothetical protein